MTPTPLLDVRDLKVVLGGPVRQLAPVRGISFSLAEGTTLGIVGESGCGKSIAMLALMGLLPPDIEVTGSASVSP
jgi:peptide/nickel transport system ATP-binding protein